MAPRDSGRTKQELEAENDQLWSKLEGLYNTLDEIFDHDEEDEEEDDS